MTIEVAAFPRHLSLHLSIAYVFNQFIPAQHHSLPASSRKEEGRHPHLSSWQAATTHPWSLTSAGGAVGWHSGSRNLLCRNPPSQVRESIETVASARGGAAGTKESLVSRGIRGVKSNAENGLIKKHSNSSFGSEDYPSDFSPSANLMEMQFC